MSSAAEQRFAARVDEALVTGGPAEWRTAVNSNTLSIIDENDNEWVIIVKEIYNANDTGLVDLPNPHLSGGDFVSDSALLASTHTSDLIPEDFGRVIGSDAEKGRGL